MSVLTYDQIEITGIDGLNIIKDISLDIRPNTHGHAIISAIATEEYQQYAKRMSENTIVKICKKEDYMVLFAGYVKHQSVLIKNQIAYANIELISCSRDFDAQPITRSFQNPNATYESIAEAVEAVVPNAMIACEPCCQEKTGASIFQYGETNFDFLVRMASRMGTSLIPDVTSNNPMVTMGVPQGRNSASIVCTDYTLGISSKYYELGGSTAGYEKAQFQYYQVTSYENYNIGDDITWNENVLKVITKKANMEKSEMLFTYELGYDTLFMQREQENKKMCGGSFKGTVSSVDQDTIKMDLDVDKNYAGVELHSYGWNPITGNLLYSMPEVGTQTVLNVGNSAGDYINCVTCLRTNGSTCQDTSTPDNKLFMVPSNKKLKLAYSQITLTNITCSLDVNDDQDIQVNTLFEIKVNGETEIIAVSGTFKMISPSQIEFLGAGLSQFTINQTIEASANDMIQNALMQLTYTPFNDSPVDINMGYDWKKMLEKVVFATVVVLAIAAMAALAIVTCGGSLVVAGATITAAGAATGVLAGAAAGGVIFGAVTLIGERIGGNSIEGSIYKALDSLCNGAMLSAALATEPVIGLWGMMSVVGLTSAYYQREDMKLDAKYGNDFWDENVTVASFISTVIADAASAGIASKINLLLENRFISQMNKNINKAIHLPKVDTVKWAKLLNKFTKYNLTIDQANINVNKKLIREILTTKLEKIFENKLLKSLLFKEISLPSNVFCDTILNELFSEMKEKVVSHEEYKTSILEGEEYFYFDEKGRLQVE